MTLVEFLRQRLDEDEAAANAWLTPFSNPDAAARDHIARHYPARALAEVDAKRRIVDLYEQALAEAQIQEVDAQLNGEVGGLAAAVVLLALPHASHPDYEEWKP